MVRIVRNRFHAGRALVLVSSLGLLSGCGTNTSTVTDNKDRATRVEENTLIQVGDLFRMRQEEGAPPPASAVELAKSEKLFPLAVGKINRGEIVLFFGVPLEEGASDTILAYEKQAPASGGHVLMQDGKTIKTMTADEFKAAKKAGKG